MKRIYSVSDSVEFSAYTIYFIAIFILLKYKANLFVIFRFFFLCK